MKINLLATIALLIAATACNSAKKESAASFALGSGEFSNQPAELKVSPAGDTIVVAELKAMPEPATVRASELVDDLRLVRLDNSTPEALVNDGQIWVTPKRIMIQTQSAVKHFDHDGKYLGDLIKRGQGPGEYPIAVYDVYADEDAGRIYAVSYNADKVMTYDTDGNHLGDIPLAYKAPKAVVRADTENRRLTIAALQFKADDLLPIIWEQDFDGNVISEVKRNNLTVVPDFSNELNFGSTADGNGFTYSQFLISSENDTLYNYVDGRLTPAMTVDFGENVPWHHLLSFPKFYLAMTFGDAVQVDENTFTIPGNTQIAIDKESLLMASIQLMIDNIGPIVSDPSWVWSKSPEYMVINLNPGDLADKIDELPDNIPGAEAADYERAKKLRETINADDNNYLVIGRWKK